MFDFDFVEEIISTLENGGLILYPTDSVWAIGCDATNVEAISQGYGLTLALARIAPRIVLGPRDQRILEGLGRRCARPQRNGIAGAIDAQTRRVGRNLWLPGAF